jgi:hypothetical protein
MDLYLITLLVLWGLAFGILALPRRVARVYGHGDAYSSWVDSTSLIGNV